MNISKLITDLSTDTNVHFYSFEQNVDTIIAKSHFLDFHFGPERVDILLDYPIPGPLMQKFVVERLPIFLDYNTENFYNMLVEVTDDIVEKLIALEYKEEEL
jgi:hypothetical protein